MPCYSPLTGWRSRRRNPSGKYSITFVKSEGYADQELTLPCSRCIGCRIEHSRQWAVRCMHEAALHENNCFITLTYNDEKLPTVCGVPTLVKSHFQKFMKRLRKKYGEGIKFYAAGEYGTEGERQWNPHYHACIFGHDFQDKEIWKTTNGNQIFTSKELERLWTDPEDEKPYGFVTTAEVTFESAAYTARYCVKKQKGKNAQDFYEVGVDPRTGEILSIQPEFALMSRRPGIGRAWLDEFKHEVIVNDSVIVRGREMKPPKYYDAVIEKEELQKYEQMKADRLRAAKEAVLNNSLARLHVRGIVKKAQLTQLKKEL